MEGLMELRGVINFPPGKIVIIYGSNQQGKTNVINAIRYNFLKEFKGRGRLRNEYDDRALPTRQELVFGAKSSIITEFEYGGNRYMLRREILSGGKRETCDLYGANSPAQKMDPEVFLKAKLKVSLLDVLFAPEITGAFKHLYSGGIDRDVEEMFKEISTLRNLSESFMQRLKRLKSSAEVASTTIETAYADLCRQLVQIAPQIADMKEFEDLKAFEPGKSAQKLELLDKKTLKVASTLKETKLSETIDEASTKANELGEIRGLLKDSEAMRQKVVQLRIVKSDHKALKDWLDSMGQIDRESRLGKPPELKDEKRRKLVEQVVSKFSKAKNDYAQALVLAETEHLSLTEISSRAKQLSKVLRLLSSGVKIGKEIAASVAKVGGEAYAIVPARLMVTDATFAEINSNPVPKGTKDEMKGYEANVKSKISRISAIKTLDNESQRAFEEFAKNGLLLLRTIVKILANKETDLENELKNWVDGLSASASSFSGRTIRPIVPKTATELISFGTGVEGQVTKAEGAQLSKVNRTLKELGIQVSRLEKEDLSKAARIVADQQHALPQLEEAGKLKTKNKLEWQKLDEQYSDYSKIPRLADEAILVLGEILAKCFDEAKLKEMMATTYTDITNQMRERRLINAVADVSPKRLKGVLRYRDRVITHPAGSEKALFSLAILTSLAYYFQTPVLIDEVANNLDSENLKAFFELVREFKDKYGVQYVLSMKTTRDFDLDGWVRDLREDISLYQIRGKEIVPVEL